MNSFYKLNIFNMNPVSADTAVNEANSKLIELYKFVNKIFYNEQVSDREKTNFLASAVLLMNILQGKNELKEISLENTWLTKLKMFYVNSFYQLMPRKIILCIFWQVILICS